MTEKSRTEYSARNTGVAMVSRMVAILMGFLTRVVFTHTLNESYVGLNGLFTDILNVLALSELGIGTAITYALYRPIAEKDKELQKSLMLLFKKLYQTVAAIIFAAGLAVIPFLKYVIKDAAGLEHVTFIYVLYLLNSVLSYLFIYKKTLIDAHQQSYIGVLFHTVFLVLQDVLQIILLVTTKNFILFLLVYIFCTIANNLCVAKTADRMYPYLKDKQIQPLAQEERKTIVRNIRAMMMHKVGNVVVNNTDNLLISSMVGIVSAGIYSNYFLIIGSVRQVLDQAFSGITASVGNLGITEEKSRVKTVFEVSFFIGQWMYGFAAICLYELLNPFVEISFGEKYLFAPEVVLVLCINFFLNGMRQASLVFRDSLGVFWYDRYKSPVEAVINLVVSVLLTYRLGIVGVFLGTIISTVTTSVWVEPFFLYKKVFGGGLAGYFLRYVLYGAVVLAAGLATHILCGLAGGTAGRIFLLRLPICLFVPNLILLICYCRTKEFSYALKKLEGLVKSDAKRHRHKRLHESHKQLLAVLTAALTGTAPPDGMGAEQIQKLVRRMEKHAVVPIAYPALMQLKLPKDCAIIAEQSTKRTVLQSYRLAKLSYDLSELFEREGIDFVLLKGTAAAGCYPVPEYRKSGDVDILLLEEETLSRAEQLLAAVGYEKNSVQPSHHHLVVTGRDGIDIELHTMLAEPFDNERANQYLKECLPDIRLHREKRVIMGYPLWVLSDGYQAFELLLHMLQHFLRSGFGLKLLCDWVYFWQQEIAEEERKRYGRLVKECGIGGFSDMITAVCVQWIGLSENCGILGEGSGISVHVTDSFLREILEAEEFGKSENSRMVVLRGTKPGDYVREFHHQMRLNYPKAGACFLLWPWLWCATLIRFMKNNRRIRGVSEYEILKKATERSRLMEKIHLFQ